MKILLRSLFIAALVLTSTQTLQAQRILPGTDHPIWENEGDVVVSRRPATTGMMNSVKGYMQGVKNRAAPEGEKYNHALSKVLEWKNEIDNDPFFRRDHPHKLGTEWDMAVHIAQDLWRATDDLLGSCGDISFPPFSDGGMCWRRECDSAWFIEWCWYVLPGSNIKSYRLPIQMVELTENRGQSGYMIDLAARPHTIAGNIVYDFLATGLEEGFDEIPIIGGLLSDILGDMLGDLEDRLGDVIGEDLAIGNDVVLSTRLMDTTSKLVGMRDHLYLYGCDDIDPTDGAALVDCLKSQFLGNYKSVDDFEFQDPDGNPIDVHMVKLLKELEVTTTNRSGVPFTEKPYDETEDRYHGIQDLDTGYRDINYHVFQPSPYFETMITTLRNIQIWGVYPFRLMLGQCERNIPDIVYFSEWPYALENWDWGTGGLPPSFVKKRPWGISPPIPAGVVYSRALGFSYLDLVALNRGSGKENDRFKTGHKQRLFNVRDLRPSNLTTLGTQLANGSYSGSADPYACTRANMIWSVGRTPNDMLFPLTRGDRPGEGGPQAPGALAGRNPSTPSNWDIEPGVCGGANMGSWAPALSRTFLQHGTSASEQGFIKAINAVRGHPDDHWDLRRTIKRRAFRIDPVRDRIQWLRDEDMRDIQEGCHKFGERAGWEYHPDQISKDVDKEDHDDEFWNVGLHWKRFRCCPHNAKRCHWSAWDLPPIPEWPWGGGCPDARDELFDIRE